MYKRILVPVDGVLDEADKMARSAGVDAQTLLVEEVGERAGVQIVKQATQWPADLIVCGTHGRRGVPKTRRPV